MATTTIKNSSGADVTVELPLTPGRAAATSSRPVALSNEDNATIGSLTETAPASDTASSGLNGRLQRVAQNITSQSTLVGSLTETAPTTDTASSGLNGRLQRIAQRLTTLIAVFANGGGTAAASVRVNLATDVALPAGTNLLGKVGLDQTTPGTTNAVAPISGQAGVAGGAGAVGATVQRVTLASDDPLVAKTGNIVTISTDVTRPANATAYTANNAMSDSTSAPTTGGYTLTGAARVSGGGGVITDAIITTSADQSTLLQGEVWIFNQAVTNINDNSAFAVSDAEIKTCVGKIAFAFEDSGNNGFYHATNLGIGFVCSGSANLRFLLKVKNAYTPVSGEVITVTLKIIQVN